MDWVSETVCTLKFLFLSFARLSFSVNKYDYGIFVDLKYRRERLSEWTMDNSNR